MLTSSLSQYTSYSTIMAKELANSCMPHLAQYYEKLYSASEHITTYANTSDTIT